jgi:hypothetical protein
MGNARGSRDSIELDEINSRLDRVLERSHEIESRLWEIDQRKSCVSHPTGHTRLKLKLKQVEPQESSAPDAAPEIPHISSPSRAIGQLYNAVLVLQQYVEESRQSNRKCKMPKGRHSQKVFMATRQQIGPDSQDVIL